MIPEEWGTGEAPAFKIFRSGAGFGLLDFRKTGFGTKAGNEPTHLGTYADTKDIALVIADLVGTRGSGLTIQRTRRRRATA